MEEREVEQEKEEEEEEEEEEEGGGEEASTPERLGQLGPHMVNTLSTISQGKGQTIEAVKQLISWIRETN